MPLPFGRSPDGTPKGWNPDVWALRMALLTARERLPYASANARLLDGVDRWVRLSGRGRPPAGPWWARTCVLVRAVAEALEDRHTAALLAPWSGLVVSSDVAAPNGFRPFGASNNK
jgi:hypothetical protein